MNAPDSRIALMAQRIMLSIREALKLKNIGSWCCQKGSEGNSKRQKSAIHKSHEPLRNN